MARMNARELRETAQVMRAQLGTNGIAERLLEPYYLTLFRRHDRIRLHVGLAGRWPSLEEVLPAAEAFGVAEGTDPTPETLRLPTQDGRCITVRTLRFAWTEVA